MRRPLIIALTPQYSSPDDIRFFTLPLLVSHRSTAPTWCAMSSDGPLINGVKTACQLSVDLRRLRRALQRKVSADGKTYWSLAFRVGVSFGGSQLRARIRWLEARPQRQARAHRQQAGVECEGVMSIVRDAVA